MRTVWTGKFFAAIVIAAIMCSILSSAARRSTAEELYVVSYADNQIRRFDAITGTAFGTFGTLTTSTFGPTHPLFGPDGNLYVQQEQESRVMRVNGTTGAALSDFIPANKSLLPLPYVQRFRNGILYVENFADPTFTHGNILKFNASTGAYLGVFVTTPGWATGFDFGPDGNLYVASRNLNRVDEFDGTSGAFIRTVVGSIFADNGFGFNFFNGASHLDFGPDGNMYVSRFGGLVGLSVIMKRFMAGGAPLGDVITDSLYESHVAGESVFAPNGVIDILDEGDFNGLGTIRQYDMTTGAFIKTLASNIPKVPVGITLRPTIKNVKGSVQITRSAYRFNAGTHTYVQRVTIKNISSSPISGPISLVFDSLTTGVTLTAVNGMTSAVAPYGSPYLNVVLAGPTLAAGGAATVSLEFVDPSNTLIAYTPRVLAGVGPR